MNKRKEVQNSKFSTLNSKFSIILVVILAGIPFVLGRYFEFNYPDPFDSASNVYSAQHILNGAKIGVEEAPSAGLGTLLVNILGVRLFGFSEFGPKLIQTVMQAVAFILMFVAMRKIFGKLPAALGVIVAAIYTSAPLIAKFGNVKEQYMIACMVMAISLLIMRQLGGKWWLCFLSGAIAAWAPLFKETGVSVIGAIGLFVIVQPIFKHRTWRETLVDIALLLAGASASLGPLYIWIIGWHVPLAMPFYFVWDAVAGLLPKAPATGPQAPSYVANIKSVMPFAEQWPRVLRYYLALCLPVSLAIGAIIVRLTKMVLSPKVNPQDKPGGLRVECADRFVLLLGVWWVLDMAFVWISPASYEQYYLPLTVSGAMTGGYLIAVYRDKIAAAVFKTKWVITGAVGFILMVVMSWHIFAGLPISPYSGVWYKNAQGQPQKRNGYVQRWDEISWRLKGYKGPWEQAGEYIRSRTTPSDKIYVWGWVPGVYLSAQRFSCTPNAFESEMHTRSPQQLEQVIDGLLAAFSKEMPKYIVDTRKQHLPLNRFKFELWPYVPQGFMGFSKGQFLPSDPQIMMLFERQWGEMTRERFGDDEARRFEIMGKFRKLIREHYEVEQIFGDEVVFKLKK